MTSDQKSKYHALGMGTDPDSGVGVDYVAADTENPYLIGSMMGDQDLTHEAGDNLPKGREYLETDNGLVEEVEWWFDYVQSRDERPESFETAEEWVGYKESIERTLNKLKG